MSARAALADRTAAHPRTVLRAMFDAAVASAMPARCVPRHLPPRPAGRVIVVGAGKAAAAMAEAVEAAWPGVEGMVVTRYGHHAPCRSIRVVEAAHPVPDAAGVAAADELLGTVAGLTADDLVLCLLSGGGSALLPALPEGVALAEEQALARALLRSGASIAEMNCVRKHVSRIKGGRLAAAAAPARVHTLLISDVPGDDPATVASGPTVPDPTTRADALAVLARHAIAPPASIRAWLARRESETPKVLANATWSVIASARDALAAAAEVAADAGYTPVILGDAVEGEAAAVAADHAAVVRAVREEGRPATAPCVLLSGGETTVTVRGHGRGGRNVEYLLALALALALDGADGVHALAADTDGIDGTQDNAGAVIDATTLARAAAAGRDAAAHLADNDAYSFFDAIGDLVVTGATRTNVNDFRAILVDPTPLPETRSS